MSAIHVRRHSIGQVLEVRFGLGLRRFAHYVSHPLKSEEQIKCGAALLPQ